MVDPTCNWSPIEKGQEKIPEMIMAKDVPKLIKAIKLQIQETQQIPGRINTKKIT